LLVIVAAIFIIIRRKQTKRMGLEYPQVIIDRMMIEESVKNDSNDSTEE
jgi:hypothetical protein